MMELAGSVCPTRVRARFRARACEHGYNVTCGLKKIPHYTILEYIVRNDTIDKKGK